MAGAPPTLAERSDAARSARRLSQRATEDLLRTVLARVEERPRVVAEILADHGEPLIAFAASRTIICANAAAEKLFGYGRYELDGKPSDLLVPVRLRQPDAPSMQATDTLTTVELPGLRRDGSEPPLSWTFGATTRVAEPIFVMVIRDRAEIEAALEELYTSEQRFRWLVEGVRDHAILMLDADGRIATWNSGAERIKGWRAEEILGQPYETFFTPEDRAAGVPAENLAAAAREGHMHVTGWRMRKDGSRFYADGEIWPLYTQDGHLQGYTKITHDLTTQRLAEETQQHLEIERTARKQAESGRERLARLHRAARALSAATTHDEVVNAVLDECLTAVDAVAGALFSSDDTGMLTLVRELRHPSVFSEQYATVLRTADTPAKDAIMTKEPVFLADARQLSTRYPDLARLLENARFEATVALPLITRGRAVGVLVLRYPTPQTFSADDRALMLTLAEMCAQALERARLFEAELSASRAKDEFLAMLGHELRNPLAPITTAIELMKLRGETHSIREREVIERQLGHITHLVDDLLDISRITRGKLDLALRPTDVADVVARAVEMASPLLEQRLHELSLTVPQGLTIHADPARMAQVIANLLTNAAKYTQRKGQIAVDASAENGQVQIRVRDNGSGIDPELLPRVFDLFAQGRRTFDRSEGGLGIGLALVKNLVSMHGGTVEVTSTVGVGSEFTVRLPLHTAATTSASSSDAPTASRAGKRRILVVDDNRDFAEMLADSLTSMGYQVALASDAVTALERLRDFHAEAALLDLGLPVLDGFELARQIRAQFPDRTPRLIAVTGYGQRHDRDRSADVGFADHLVKPIDLDAMVSAIERP